MKRASYREAVAWIALNDEPTAMIMADIQGFISVLLVADLFGQAPRKVAVDVIKFRAKEVVRETIRQQEGAG